MFVYLAIIAVSIFSMDQDPVPHDIFARLGQPRIETCDYRIHVGTDGEWTFRLTQVYRVEGVTSDDLNDFEAMLIEHARNCGAQSSQCTEVRENCRQCEAQGKSDDSLKLGSLLMEIFDNQKCNLFHWDRESVEWGLARVDAEPLSNDKKKTVNEIVGRAALNIIFTVAFNEMLQERGITQAEWVSVANYLPKSQLVLTTNGKITAESPAEISEDGKTMTLDLSKLVMDSPEQWSIRIDGL